MHWTTTPQSLLQRLRDAGDQGAWEEFDRIYGSLILRYCRARGLPHADADDLRQLVMSRLCSALRSFRYSPERGRFRSYLRRAIHNALHRRAEERSRRPSPAPLAEDATNPPGREAEDSLAFEAEWRAHHLRRAMQAVRQTTRPRSVAVFEALLGGASIAEAAARHGISEESVYKIRTRIKQRLRELVAAQVAAEDQL